MFRTSSSWAGSAILAIASGLSHLEGRRSVRTDRYLRRLHRKIPIVRSLPFGEITRKGDHDEHRGMHEEEGLARSPPVLGTLRRVNSTAVKTNRQYRCEQTRSLD